MFSIQNLTKILAIINKLRLFKLYQNSTKMSDSSLLKPPLEVSGLTSLNKSKFEKTITVPCLILKDVKVSSILPLVKKFLLKMENFKPVDSCKSEVRIFLNPDLVAKWDDLNDEIKTTLKETDLIFSPLKLTYDNYSLETILRAVLPKNSEGLSSFTKIGHIVHVNLREHLEPYKDLIGQVLYEKVPNCKTVVNKTANIDNTYRNFTMEILRGDNDMITSVKENKCVFEFDFSKVYWNSRLCTEHERIVNLIKDGAVFDIFAGVGPFSIPLAKKKCQVFANDLNPESFKWLNHNAKKNKIDEKFLQTFNKDAKDFILDEVKTKLPQFLDKKVYILMNLPALAVDFLSNFVGLYDSDCLNFDNPPIAIVYCFAKGEDYEKIAKNLLFKSLGFEAEDKIIELFKVRTVSSMKEMVRITLKLDRQVLVKSHKRKLAILNESQLAMGKNKKTNSVFKVAGAKSLKLKAKAKTVKSDLKKINIKNKIKTTEIDKELVNLEEKIRNTNQVKVGEKNKVTSKLPQVGTIDKEKQKESQEALNQLNAMQL